ncbi:hypothetical protein TVAG_051070 [Trichomonas vaginalis G3]|uniref:Uncharacterized protein n=1 Tax=Trichomonas vaginalis (strain ATCC PRA-98 / G3) TaxID=412133 RepID=A2EER6_TRIV3|nr:hydroxyacid-oxoacid transhydrogenase protein [Trichomonas vaginalis G3]EAY08872.1 hypothetical protein TVAG_051070 [Trichomonas vaginalis G3]KAI5489367.1 hydroxyacid-oxoacid transhydrogenase protein [Trichomonas vaginalis G3]|eukprot:XP_001321095.1 hypothetical protein [Trichomonas vaginalis G3]
MNIEDGTYMWDMVKYWKHPSKATPIGTVMTIPATGSEWNNGAVISHRSTKEKLPLINNLSSVNQHTCMLYTLEFHWLDIIILLLCEIQTGNILFFESKTFLLNQISICYAHVYITMTNDRDYILF